MTGRPDYEMRALHAAACGWRDAVRTVERQCTEMVRRMRLAADAGATLTEIAAMTGVPPSTCRRWMARYR